MNPRVKKRIFLAVKLLIAMALLVWVLSKTHLHDYVVVQEEYGGGSWTVQQALPNTFAVRRGSLWWAETREIPRDHVASYGEGQLQRKGLYSSIAEMRKGLALLAVLGFPLSLVIGGWRFWYLLRVQEIHITLWESVRLTYLGQFFNQVIPGTMGGDLVKAWYVHRHTDRTATVLLTIFVDRVMGLVELVLMSGVMLLVVLGGKIEPWEKLQTAAMALGILTAGMLCMFALVLSARLRRLLHLQKLWSKTRIAHHITAAGQAVRVLRARPGVLLAALGQTVLAHIFFIGAIALLGISLRLDLPAYRYFVFLPLIYILGAVPISPGGVGLVERLYLAFLQTPAVGASEVVALAMLARIVPALWALPGLIVAVRGPRLPDAEDMEAELASSADDTGPEE